MMRSQARIDAKVFAEPVWPQSAEAEKAMRRHGQMIDLVCGNLLAGEDAFKGVGQFIDQAASEGEAR